MSVSEISSILQTIFKHRQNNCYEESLLFPALIAIILLMGSCKSAQKVAYFKNIDSISLAASKGLYDARIMPKDQLTITVVTSDPATSKPFNLAMGSTLSADGKLGGSTGSLIPYLVIMTAI